MDFDWVTDDFIILAEIKCQYLHKTNKSWLQKACIVAGMIAVAALHSRLDIARDPCYRNCSSGQCVREREPKADGDVLFLQTLIIGFTFNQEAFIGPKFKI